MTEANPVVSPDTPADSATIKNLFSQFPAMICILEGAELRCTFANPLFTRLYSDRELIGKTPGEMIPELEGQGYFEMLDKVYQTGEPYYGYALPAEADWENDGQRTTRFFNFVYFPYKSGNKTIGIIAFGLEVTDHVKAINEVQNRQTLIDTISKAAPTGLWICDQTMACIFVNQAWITWTGRPFDAHLGMGWSTNLIEEDQEGAYQTLLRCYQTKEPYLHEYRVTCADGTIKWCLSSGNPWYYPSGEFGGFAGSSTDITERKQEERRIQSMVDALPIMAWTAKPNGELDYFNRRWYDYTGQTPAEAMGNGWANTMPVDTEKSIFTKWMYSLEHKVPYEVEAMYRRKDGQYRWHIARAEPILTEKGDVLYWLGTSTDIHDQKMLSELLEQSVQERTRDLTAINLELKRSNENLEQFASVASHDLKEPLRKIQMFSDMLQDVSNSNREVYIRKIRESSNRMMNLIEDLLDFASLRRTPEQVERVDLNSVFADAKLDLELLILEKEASVTAEKLPQVNAIPHQMQQLFANLIGNALKYSKHDEPPRITVSAERTGRDELNLFPALNPAKAYVTLHFTDNGIGFKASEAEKIFAIFQRLHSKGVYSGTGVGLALCKKVAHNHDGEIYATSKPGVGSTFSVILPG